MQPVDRTGVNLYPENIDSFDTKKTSSFLHFKGTKNKFMSIEDNASNISIINMQKTLESSLETNARPSATRTQAAVSSAYAK